MLSLCVKWRLVFSNWQGHSLCPSQHDSRRVQWNSPRSFELTLLGGNVGVKCPECAWPRCLPWQHCWRQRNDPPIKTADFTAQMVILNHSGQTSAGFAPRPNCQMPSKFTKLKGKNILERSWKPVHTFLNCGSVNVTIIDMVPGKPTCTQSASDYFPLGNFDSWDMRKAVVGVIKAVDKNAVGAGMVTSSA